MSGVMEMDGGMQQIKVHCPKCSNQRLFDLYGPARGTVRIKCPACRQEVELHLEKCDRKREARMNAYFHRIINSKENRD